MKISTNLMGFHHIFGIEKTVDIFAEAGFDGIDFNSDIQHLYDDSHNKDYYINLRKHAENRCCCKRCKIYGKSGQTSYKNV